MVRMVELTYSERTGVFVVSGITQDEANELGAYLLEKSHPSGDLVPTGVTGTYDPETGRLRILCPGSVSEEVRRNLGLCFPAVGVNSSKGDDVVHGQFGMQLNPETYSGDDVKIKVEVEGDGRTVKKINGKSASSELFKVLNWKESSMRKVEKFYSQAFYYPFCFFKLN